MRHIVVSFISGAIYREHSPQVFIKYEQIKILEDKINFIIFVFKKRDRKFDHSSVFHILINVKLNRLQHRKK
ncbi:hypothetical protein JM47_01405 [Ureaplasma diversum]|uniref:Uncharacterized protein n=1 Tax=Ureaplasma diversum TaxID=42094 RepID=A0A0C5RBL9_9BACT|nr:hypothetical protein JM47_01405 [Ureaplasma diversum]